MAVTVLVLGAGTGGVITARELSKKVGKGRRTGEVNILVFEKSENNVFAPSLLWLMVGKRKPEQVYRKTEAITGAGIEVIIGEIEKVDPEHISVSSNGREYKGDHMVISLGVEQSAAYGLNGYGHNFYTLEGAAEFSRHLQDFKGGKIAVLVSSLPFKCPAAPYEAAMLIESHIRKKGLDKKCEISLYTPEQGPMGVAGKELSDAVRQTIERKGVRFFAGHQVSSVTEDTLTFNNGKSAHYDLLAYTPGHQCPSVIKKTALVGESGWIEVDRHSMETRFPNVYAIGDIIFIPLEIGKPLPKAGVFAHFQAETVAHNIAQRIAGKKPDRIFNGMGQCFLELGDGKAGYAGGNFYASPAPNVKMKIPGFWWHWAKLWFEKYWFFKYF